MGLLPNKIKSTLQLEERYTLANHNHVDSIESFIHEFGVFNLSKASEKECYQKLSEANSLMKIEFKHLKKELDICIDSYNILKEKSKLNSIISSNDDLKSLIDHKKKLESKKNSLNNDIIATSSQIMRNREIVHSLTNKSPSPIK